MTFGERLLQSAFNTLSDAKGESSSDVILRRAVSSSYYALFHQINGDAVSLLAPNVDSATNHRIQRWFDHGETKKICGLFLRSSLDQPLLGLVGESASIDLQLVCRTFIKLQEARHNADYDLSYILTPDQTLQYLRSVASAIRAWERVKKTAEGNIFILSLLLWKNWEKERR